jgi:molybdopterin-guanine dinucleotide biosynthesis protein A
VLPCAPIRDKTTLPKLRKMIGNARLAHAKNFLKLRNTQFVPFEQEHKTQPGLIGKESERIYD